MATPKLNMLAEPTQQRVRERLSCMAQPESRPHSSLIHGVSPPYGAEPTFLRHCSVAPDADRHISRFAKKV
jgi:hypothetical protein